MSDQLKYVLDETQIPKTWYNLAADLPQPLPPVLHPGTKQPVGPADLEPLFPMALILQEVSAERTIDIPEPIRDVYRMWRPSPLIRARRLERALDTPAKIYFKYEGPAAGSHKPKPRYRKPGTTRSRASRGSRPRPAPASGARPWRLPAGCSASRLLSFRSASPTTRNPIAAR